MFVCTSSEHIAINAMPFTVATTFVTKFVRNLTEYALIYAVYPLLGVMPFSLSEPHPEGKMSLTSPEAINCPQLCNYG